MSMTPDALVTLAGIVLSLIFAYLPWVKDWFDQTDPRVKPLINAAVLLLVAAGKLAYDCRVDTACIVASWQSVLWTWLAALVANQTTYMVSVRQVKRAQNGLSATGSGDSQPTER